MSPHHDDALVSWLVDEVASLREEVGRLRGELADARARAAMAMEPAIATSLPAQTATVRPPATPPVEADLWDEPSAVIEIPGGNHRLSRRQVFAALGGVTGAAAAAAVLSRPADVAAAPPSGGHSSTTLASATAAGATSITITDSYSLGTGTAGAGSYGIGIGTSVVIDPGPNMEVRYGPEPAHHADPRGGGVRRHRAEYPGQCRQWLDHRHFGQLGLADGTAGPAR